MTRFPTRRRLLAGGAAALAMPYVWSGPARAASQVVVRNPGGAYSDAQKQHIYDPFTK
jgi:spermidine/putrescine-binding protein